MSYMKEKLIDTVDDVYNEVWPKVKDLDWLTVSKLKLEMGNRAINSKRRFIIVWTPNTSKDVRKAKLWFTIQDIMTGVL